MSTNFGEMSTSKVRKKPEFSGFFLVVAKDLLMFAKQHLPFLFGTAVSFPRNVLHPATGKEAAK